MRFRRSVFIFILLLSAAAGSYSQNCPTIGQNPGSAFPVCGTSSFSQATVPLCGGSPIPGPCGASAGLTDVNPFWYRFTCYVTGTLGFQIRPVNLSDDYDWQLFDITNHNPNDVYTDASLFVACNWSGFGGVTGAGPTGTSLINCDGNVPIFSSMPTIIAGHEYLLLISHFTPSQSGYQLTFSGGTGIINDPNNPVPKFSSASSDCDPTKIIVRFNKLLKCTSLAANGSDFLITPAATIVSASGFGCTSGFAIDSVLLTVSAPLAPGNYTITAATGTDGNTLLDNCDNNLGVGESVSFTVSPPTPLAMGTITPPGCAPNSLTVTFAEPIKCISVAANGSDFTINGPSAVTVTSVNAINCDANGETTTLTIQLAAPILTGGNYQVNAATGSDGNTIVGRCGRQVAAGSNAAFTVPIQSPIAMGTIGTPPCLPQSVTLTFTDPILCNSIAANGSDFTITGPSAVTINSAAAVNCNASGETMAISIQFAAPISTAGNYTITMATGSDGNTLIGNCGRIVNAGGTAGFTLSAQPPVPMGTITPPPCLPQSITLNFTSPLQCNSIAPNGSDFIITGPSAVTISSATAINCTGGETNSIILQFAAPVAIPGTYNVTVATGSDGNTLISGNCGAQVNAGDMTSFTLAAQPAIPMGTITPPACLPQSITLNFTVPLQCSSVASNGSDFTISGPSPVTITSATAVNCTGGQTNSITIQFAAPVSTPGTYTITMASGSDGNTLTGDCGAQVNAGGVASFTLAAQPAIPMGTVIPPPCIPQSITLNFTAPLQCSSVASNGSDFVITGPSPVTIVSATAVNCTGGETNSITLQFSLPILVTGNYQVQVVAGSDGNTLIGQCGAQVNAGSNTSFSLAAQQPLPMGTITQPSCSPSSLTITFADPVNCNSIAPDGTDFVITGPSAATIASASGNCSNGITNSITIQLSAPITISGVYQLKMTTGSDGNTLTGDCNRNVTAGDMAAFTIPVVPPVPMDSIVPVACSPNSLALVFSGPIRCSSIASNGSDFIVTGPSPVTVSSASGTCDANGLTTKITLQLASPIVKGGTYQVQLATGSDGNTLLSDCNRPTPVGSIINFIAADTVSAEFQYQVQYDCDRDQIDFSHDGQHNVNSWTWTVNNVATSTAQSFSQSFSAASQNTVKLVVSNGVCSDMFSTTIVLNNKVTIDFDIPESACPDDTVSIVNKSSGPVDDWQWDFGNGNTSIVKTPPAQVYPTTGIETLYTVSLTGSNASGCQVTATKIIKVLSGCIIAVPSAFTPNNDGKNDYLYPLNALKAEKLDFKVFNRWGQMVFHSNDWRRKWDGRVNGIVQATGVYVWVLEFVYKDTGQKVSMRGTTTLIR